MPFTKIILSPITEKVTFCELTTSLTEHKIPPKSIHISRHKESSFYEYSEGFALIEFKNEHDAVRARDAVQSGEIEFSGQKFSATAFDDDYSPVEQLPDQCLQRIFSLLPIGRRMDVEKVCKRWKKIVLQCSYSNTILDIRDFSTFEDAKRCIIRYSTNLKEVYYNINSPVSFLAKYCDNLENLTIDYEKDGRFHDGRDVQRRLTWHAFKCLSRITLRNIRDTDCNFIQYLPETLIELQLLNLSDCPLPYSPSYQTLVDLSHLPNLQSLKLIGFDFTDGLLVGFDELSNLSHLFIENCQLSEKHRTDLSSFDTLEYLTVRSLLPDNKDDWHDVFESSKNLKYAEISYVTVNPFWDGVSSRALRHLKYLRVNHVQWHDIHEITEYGLPKLEYLDCQQSKNITDSDMCKIVRTSPNLKYVYAQGCGLTGNIVDRIRSIKANQTKKVVLKLFVGEGEGKHSIPNYYSKHFVVDTAPLEEDKMPDVNVGWFTKDCETIKRISTVLPILDDSSPIEALPTECLCAIFSLLSLDDRLNVEEVCQRWRSIILTIWKKQKTFDVRDLRYPEDAKKCVERCGEKLEEIHYYKDHELSVIAECCSSVKKVTIDFQDRMYYDPKPRRGKIDIPDLEPILVQLKSLTHLSLEKIDKTYDFDFLKDLPETLLELHIFPESELTVADIDVGKFSRLRALSLNNFNYETDSTYTPIRGIEKLENLQYLRLESWCINTARNPLRNLENLEYLSLQNTTGFADRDIVSVLERNKNLKYLNLSGFTNLTNPVLNAVSNLQHLRTLCLNYEDDDDNLDDHYADNEYLDQIKGMPSLEYFDYGMSTIIKEEALVNMISSSPNLKIMTIESDEYKTRRIIAAASKAVAHRTGDDPLLVIALGDEVNSLGKNNMYSSHVLTCEELDTEEAIVFEIEWNEWYIANCSDWYVKSSDEDDNESLDENREESSDEDDHKLLNEDNGDKSAHKDGV